MEKEPVAKSPSGRVKRVPVGQRNVLTVKGKDENFEYRIVNNEADRIEMFKDAGYEIEKAANVRIGDKRVNDSSPSGSLAEVSVGGGSKAYLMKIPKELYQEDQQAKLAKIRQLEQSMKTPSGDGQYGKTTIEVPK